VFHPESRYSDFVGGLRPESVYKVGSGADQFIGATGGVPGEPFVQYVLQPGPFLKAYHLACLYPDRSIVLIIEELSRANAAHVFGDTLQLLDRIEDESSALFGFSVYEIEPRPDVRSWLTFNDIGHDHVAVGNLRAPSNLYIWATMNRSDQNARQLDSAFLRRWSKQYMSYDVSGAYDEQLVKYNGRMIPWGELRRTINDRLSGMQGIPEDKLIGPYFLPRKRLANPSDIYEDLFGYIWNDVLKTRAGDFFSNASTFAELQRVWNDGNGAPLGQLGTLSVARESEA
jgi:5-methylcytosine-specific restriction endonuclease McrBC GTP-binding regulatory subunit McrB